MADTFKNTISILIQAQDEASAVLAAVSEQVQAAQDAITGSTTEMATGIEAASARVTEAQTAIATGNDELAADVEVSNATIIASYRAMSAAMEESAAASGGSGASLDLKNSAGLGGLGSITGLGATASVALAVAAALAVAVKSAADFQQEITRLYTTAGETAPLQQLEEGISQVAETTGESTSQLTMGLYYISSAGYNAASGLDILKAAAEGAKSENADLATVSNALTTVMHDYGAGTNQATMYMDELITGVSEGKMTLQDFSSSLSTVLPIANQVGLSFAQIAGAEATLTEGGVDAAQSTQDLKAIIQNLETPTAVEIKNMQQYGLSAVGLAQNLGKEGLVGTLTEVVDAITADMGPSGLVLQQTLQSSTVAAANLKQMIAGAPEAVQSLATALVNGSISYAQFRTDSQSLPEGDTNFLKQIEAEYNQANSFNQLLTSNKPGAQTLDSAIKGIFGQSDATNGVLLLTQNLPHLQENIDNVANSAKNAGTNIDGWSKVQGNFNTQISETWQTLQVYARGVGDEILPPLTIVVQALDRVLQDIIHFDDELPSYYEDIGRLFMGWGQDVGQWATDVGGYVSDVVSYFAGLPSAIGQGVDEMGSEIASDVRQWMSDLATGIQEAPNFAESLATDIVDGVKLGFDDVVRDAPQWGQDAAAAYEKGLQELAAYDVTSILRWADDATGIYQDGFAVARQLYGGLEDGVKAGLQNAPQWGDDIADAVEKGFDEGVKDAIQWGKDLLNAIKNGFIIGVASAIQWGQDLITSVARGIRNGFHDLVTDGRDMIVAIVTGLRNGVGDIVTFFNQLPGMISDALKQSGKATAENHLAGFSGVFHDAGRMKQIGDDILKGLGIAIAAVAGGVLLLAASLGIAVINGIIDGIKGAIHLLSDAILAIWSGIKGAFDTLTRDLIQWADDAIDAVVKVFETLPGKITGAVSSAGKSFISDIGHDLHISGFASGTNYAPGGLSLVGENGPELVNLPQGSQVLTNAETRSALSGGGKSVVIQNLNVYNQQDAGMVVRQIGWQLALS